MLITGEVSNELVVGLEQLVHSINKESKDQCLWIDCIEGSS